MNRFAERLTEELKIAGLTQAVFASKIGVSQKSVSRWCNGQREPSFDMLLAICRELDVSADYILGLEE